MVAGAWWPSRSRFGKHRSCGIRPRSGVDVAVDGGLRVRRHPKTLSRSFGDYLLMCLLVVRAVSAGEHFQASEGFAFLEFSDAGQGHELLLPGLGFAMFPVVDGQGRDADQFGIVGG